jgi:putative phage-type endonuclease
MIEQRTTEWLDQRKGKFTASEIHKLMGIKGMGKTGETYVWEKVAEELGATMPEISTFAMTRGTNMEPEAKQFYMKEYNCTVSDQPFLIAPWCDQAGCSPDGLVVEYDDDSFPMTVRKGLEIKCPVNPAIHLQNFTIEGNGDFKDLRPEYYWQVMMSMAVTGLKSWDFVSFYPDIDPAFQMFRIEIMEVPADIDLLKLRINDAVIMKVQILGSL